VQDDIHDRTNRRRQQSADDGSERRAELHDKQSTEDAIPAMRPRRRRIECAEPKTEDDAPTSDESDYGE
jgi:hypothetical protein